MQRRASSSYGRHDRAGRADVDARRARAAVRRLRRRRRQRQVGVDLAQEKPRALVARQQQRVLAAPAEAGLRGQRHLEHRRAVGEHAIAEIADLVANRRGEPLQPAAQDLVVIAAQRIARDERLARIGEHVRGRARRGRQVVHPRRDHANRAGNELGRPGARGAVACHVIHVAVTARGQPLQQPRFFLGEFGVGDADFLEAQCAAPMRNLRRERGPIAVGVRRCVSGAGCCRRRNHAQKRTASAPSGILCAVRERTRAAG